MKSSMSSEGMEALGLKRATFEGNDKVRYRVYREEGDFVAVIAESALMAMKVSGIMNPHRIVRDLPNEHVTIEAQRLSKTADNAPVMMALQQKNPERTRLNAEMNETPPTPLNDRFVPMKVKDLDQKNSKPWARVLTPDMVEQAQAKAAPPEPKPEPVAPPAPPSQPEPEPVQEPEPELAPEPAEAPPSEPAGDPDVLSEEEVQKLLNG